MSFAVFLDIDGVLNSRTTCERTQDYHVGIDDLRVAVLAGAIKKYGPTKIILSSDWKELRPEEDDYVILDDNEFDFRDYSNIWERLIRTNGIERAEFASKTPAIEAILFMDYIKEVS